MSSYICLACNENCMHSEQKMCEMGLLDGTEIIDTLCPAWGEFTEFHVYEGEEE